MDPKPSSDKRVPPVMKTSILLMQLLYSVLANGGPLLQATLSDLPSTSAGVGANTPRLPFAHLATSESMDRMAISGPKDGKMVDFKGENQLQMVDFLPS